MNSVEIYARVRRAVLVDGMSRRAAAREFGLARKAVHKMLEFSGVPFLPWFSAQIGESFPLVDEFFNPALAIP
jgi:hypothetical protein